MPCFKRLYLLPLLLLLLCVGTAFGPALRNGFVNFDDESYVSNNPAISSGLTAEGLKWVFTQSHIGNWNPLTGLSHMLDCQLYGLDPLGHHLTNLMLHAAVTVLLFTALNGMTGSIWKSALATALFAVHPLRVESVVWVSERKDVLSGLFFMLTLLAWLRFVRQVPSWKRHVPVMLLFAVGLMSKPMLVTLPFVLLLLDFWPLSRRSEGWKSLLKEKLPLFALSIFFCVAAVSAQGIAVASLGRFPIPKRLANALISYVVYLRQMVWPRDLVAFYPHPDGMPPVWMPTGALLLLAALSAGAWIRRRKQPWLLTGWLWYLGMLVPVIGLVQVGGHAHADRFTYLPMIGICIVIVWGLAPCCTRHLRPLGTGLLGAMIVSTLILATRAQTAHWRNSTALWSHTLAHTERNHVAWNGMGMAAMKDKDFDKAEACFRNAVACAPGFPPARMNLGIALASLVRLDEAAACYRETIRIAPSYVEAHFNLGRVHMLKGQHDAAAESLRQVLHLNPDDVETLILLATISSEEDAVRYYTEALRISPDQMTACNNLAWILCTSTNDLLRNSGRAVEVALRADRLAGGINPDVLDTLAAAYAADGRFQDAIRTLQHLIDLSGDPDGAIGRRMESYRADIPPRK